MFATLVLSAVTVAQPPAIPAEATSWVKQHAIPFKTAEAGNGFDDLRPLKAIIGDARIVSLGEPTHGTREAFQMKHRLMEFLATEMGFTIFSIEANMPESYDLNQYVIDGKGDPKRLIGGMYFWTWNTEEVLGMVEWMRTFNLAAAAKDDRPIQFTGFDMQTSAVAGGIVRDAVSKHLPDLSEEVTGAYKLVEGARFSSPKSAFGVATGTFPVEAARGKKVTFSGWIRTEALEGYAGLWWRADGPEGVGAFDNMGGRGPSGTSDWTRYEIVLDIPADTRNINFGLLMPGDGAAWFDDLEVRLDGEVYADPKRFSFDFEEPATPGFFSGPGSYAAGPSEEKPHGGLKCFEIRKKPAPAVEPVEPGDAHAGALKVLGALEARRDELAKAMSPTEADWVVQNARVVEQCARMFGGGMGAAGSNIRDESMADNVAWILKHNPGAKIVLWAHNAHVSRGKMWGTQWMGSYLEKKFPCEMVVVGFATGVGAYTAIKQGAGLRQDNVLAQPPMDSIESYLESAGVPRLILDIRSAKPGDPGSGWLAEERPMRGIGAMAMEEQFSPCMVRDLYDVLVYQDQTTAAKQLETKPGR